jgi:hypothetical protein
MAKDEIDAELVRDSSSSSSETNTPLQAERRLDPCLHGFQLFTVSVGEEPPSRTVAAREPPGLRPPGRGRAGHRRGVRRSARGARFSEVVAAMDGR